MFEVTCWWEEERDRREREGRERERERNVVEDDEEGEVRGLMDEECDARNGGEEERKSGLGRKAHEEIWREVVKDGRRIWNEKYKCKVDCKDEMRKKYCGKLREGDY